MEKQLDYTKLTERFNELSDAFIRFSVEYVKLKEQADQLQKEKETHA